MNTFLAHLFVDPKGEDAKRGRPRAWDSVEDMQKAIMKYFTDCANNTVEQPVPFGDGVTISVSKPLIPTVEGLCLILGIDRKTLLNYQKEEQYADFFHTIKRAKEYITACKTHALLNGGGNVPGLIFDLKNNADYVEKIEADSNINMKHKGTVTHKVNIIIDQ